MLPTRSCRLLRPIALLALAMPVAAMPAGAQPFDRSWGPSPYNRPPPLWPFEDPGERVRPLPPFAVVNRLEDQGYDDVGRPRYDGSTYVIDATAPDGRRVRLTVDAFRGRLLDRSPLGGSSPRRGEGRSWDDDEDEPLRPSRSGRLDALPPEMPESDQRRLERFAPEPVAPRRQAGRPAEPLPLDGPDTLPPPVDARLAPGPNEIGRPVEGRAGSPAAPAQREATRPDASGGRPYGVNPDTAGPRRRPAEAARPTLSPAAPIPASPLPSPGAQPPVKAEANADPARASKPVRVIGGVTPMNPNPPAAAPSE